MPPMRRACLVRGNGDEPQIATNAFQVKKPCTGAEPCVRLLQCQDICADFRNDRCGPVKIAATIHADALWILKEATEKSRGCIIGGSTFGPAERARIFPGQAEKTHGIRATIERAEGR